MSNPVILIMLKTYVLIYKKQTKPKYKEEKYITVQTSIDGLNRPLQP